MISLGLDVGGANTKAILIEKGKVRDHWLKYIPLWKDKNALRGFLKRLSKSVSPKRIGVTMTGELCDIFRTKREGVIHIVKTVSGIFGDELCNFVSLDGNLLTRSQSLSSPEKLMAANWVASAIIVGREFPNCIFIDAGSTTVDIIPVRNGRPRTMGLTDFQRLRTGELVYTGVLRTPLPCVCSQVEMGGEKIGVAAENFAIMADVYRTLGVLKEDEYNSETPDGRGKDEESCMRRIARSFCSDLEELGENFVLKAAEIFRSRQVELVAEGLTKVINSHKLPTTADVLMAGVGRGILIDMAARRVGLRRLMDLATIYGQEAALMTPAFAAGMLAMEVRKGGRGG